MDNQFNIVVERQEMCEYIGIDLPDDMLNGDVIEVAKTLLDLHRRVTEEYNPYGCEKHTYHRLEIETEHEYDSGEINLTGYYWESDESMEQRRATLIKAAKEKAQKKLDKEKKKAANERKLYEELQKKYGKQ